MKTTQIKLAPQLYRALRNVALNTDRSLVYHANEALEDGIRLELFTPAILRVGSEMRPRTRGIQVSAGLLEEVHKVCNEKGVRPAHFIAIAIYLHCLCVEQCLKSIR